jgi:hypothetical protein
MEAFHTSVPVVVKESSDNLVEIIGGIAILVAIVVVLMSKREEQYVSDDQESGE